MELKEREENFIKDMINMGEFMTREKHISSELFKKLPEGEIVEGPAWLYGAVQMAAIESLVRHKVMNKGLIKVFNACGYNDDEAEVLIENIEEGITNERCKVPYAKFVEQGRMFYIQMYRAYRYDDDMRKTDEFKFTDNYFRILLHINDGD